MWPSSILSCFKRSPIVVMIRVPAREIGEPYAQVTSAVRDLADDISQQNEKR